MLVMLGPDGRLKMMMLKRGPTDADDAPARWPADADDAWGWGRLRMLGQGPAEANDAQTRPG